MTITSQPVWDLYQATFKLDEKAAATPPIPLPTTLSPIYVEGLQRRRAVLVTGLSSRLAALSKSEVDILSTLEHVERTSDIEVNGRYSDDPQRWASSKRLRNAFKLHRDLLAKAKHATELLGILEAPEKTTIAHTWWGTDNRSVMKINPVGSGGSFSRLLSSELLQLEMQGEFADRAKSLRAQVEGDVTIKDQATRERLLAAIDSSSKESALRAAHSAFYAILERAWAYQKIGLNSNQSRKAAFTMQVSEGFPVDMADAIHMQLLMHAAANGAILSPPGHTNSPSGPRFIFESRDQSDPLPSHNR